jgi:hypothetical protein
MSKSGQWFVAATQGTEFTMYSVMRKLGIPLSPEQERTQALLESKYPRVINKEDLPDGQSPAL